MSVPSIPAGTSIGHVHLKVADLDRSIRFYHELMGFDVTARYGKQAALYCPTCRKVLRIVLATRIRIS